MNGWLALVVCLASIRNPGRCVMVAAVMAVQWLHYRWFDDAPSALAYYGTAALADAIIIWILSRCRGALAADLTTINTLAICVHAVGWIAYEAYLPPMAYNASIQVLFCAQVARMIWQGGENDGGGLAARADWPLLVRMPYRLRHWAHMGKGE